MSLLLYLAEPPGQTFDDPAYGPRRPAKCAATRRFLISVCAFTKDCTQTGASLRYRELDTAKKRNLTELVKALVKSYNLVR